MLHVTSKDIIKLLYMYCKKNHISMSHFAKEAGVSKAWLSKLWRHDAKISLSLAEKLLSHINYEIVIKKKENINESDKVNYIAEYNKFIQEYNKKESRLKKIKVIQTIKSKSRLRKK